jgi:hypothetical protein
MRLPLVPTAVRHGGPTSIMAPPHAARDSRRHAPPTTDRDRATGRLQRCRMARRPEGSRTPIRVSLCQDASHKTAMVRFGVPANHPYSIAALKPRATVRAIRPSNGAPLYSRRVPSHAGV